MQLSFDKSNIAQTTAVTLVTLAALALFALVAAYWTWEWFAPRPEPRAQAAANTGSSVVAANGLFGNLELKRDRNSASPTGIAIRLLGIMAATSGRSGYAVIQLEPRKILAVREGDDIAPGIRLAEIATDHLILERGGTRETLTWPAKNTSMASVAPRTNK